MKVVPEGRTELDFNMSNFDHVIPKEAETALRREDCWMEYSAHNFWSRVWFEGNQFCAEIWSMGFHRETLTAESLTDLKHAACERWGSD